MSDFIRAALIGGRALNRASCCIIVTSLISCNVCPSCYSGGKSKVSKFPLTRTARGNKWLWQLGPPSLMSSRLSPPSRVKLDSASPQRSRKERRAFSIHIVPNCTNARSRPEMACEAGPRPAKDSLFDVQSAGVSHIRGAARRSEPASWKGQQDSRARPLRRGGTRPSGHGLVGATA